MTKKDPLKIIEDNYKRNRDLLIANFDQCWQFADFVPIMFATRFGGQSIYYHHKALLAAKKDFLEDEHIEMIHKVLKAWGMGGRGMDLVPSKDLKKQLYKYKHDSDKQEIQLKYEKKRIDKMDNNSIEEIVKWMFDNDIKNKIKGSEKNTKPKIVLLSKTFHHILPNIIPPIDRQYSLRFMKWKREDFNAKKMVGINSDEKRLARIFIEGMRDFFKNTEKGQFLVNEKLVKPDPEENVVGSFNTSLPKIFDNLVVAFVLLQRAKLSVASIKAK